MNLMFTSEREVLRPPPLHQAHVFVYRLCSCGWRDLRAEGGGHWEPGVLGGECCSLGRSNLASGEVA